MKYLPSCHGRKGRLDAEEAEPIVPSMVHGAFLQHWKFIDLNVIGRNSLEFPEFRSLVCIMEKREHSCPVAFKNLVLCDHTAEGGCFI